MTVSALTTRSGRSAIKASISVTRSATVAPPPTRSVIKLQIRASEPVGACNCSRRKWWVRRRDALVLTSIRNWPPLKSYMSVGSTCQALTNSIGSLLITIISSSPHSPWMDFLGGWDRARNRSTSCATSLARASGEGSPNSAIRPPISRRKMGSKSGSAVQRIKVTCSTSWCPPGKSIWHRTPCATRRCSRSTLIRFFAL